MTDRDPQETFATELATEPEVQKRNNHNNEDLLTDKIFRVLFFLVMAAVISWLSNWIATSTAEKLGRWKAAPTKKQTILEEHERVMKELLWAPSEILPGDIDTRDDTWEFSHFIRSLIYDCSREQISREYQKINDIEEKTMWSVYYCYRQTEQSVHHNSQAVRYIRWTARGIYKNHKPLALFYTSKYIRGLPPTRPSECAMDILTEYLSTSRDKIKLGSVSAGTNISIGQIGIGGQGAATFAQETAIGIGVRECPDMNWTREGSNKSITLGPEVSSDPFKFLLN